MPAEAAVLGLRLLVLFFLVPAFLLKLRDRQRFARTLAAWRVLPATLVGPGAAVVLLLEGAIVVSFATAVGLPAGALVGAFLFTGFALGAASVLARRLAPPCGCYSLDIPERVSPVTVLRSSLLALACGAVAALAWGRHLPRGAFEGAPAALLAVLALAWVAGQARRFHARAPYALGRRGRRAVEAGRESA